MVRLKDALKSLNIDCINAVFDCVLPLANKISFTVPNGVENPLALTIPAFVIENKLFLSISDVPLPIIKPKLPSISLYLPNIVWSAESYDNPTPIPMELFSIEFISFPVTNELEP